MYAFPLRRESRKASIRLADDLKALILRGGLEPGSRLPNLDDLVRQSGYSVATAREALRILEREGLVEVRRGMGGGVFVRRPDYENIARSLRLILRFNRDTPGTLLEARRELEALCARLAAERISQEELEALRASVERHRQSPDSVTAARENLVFHLGVVRATRNAVLQVLVEALRSFLYDTTVHLYYSRDKIAEAVDAHAKIVDALAAHDPELAARRMSKHLAAFEEYLVETGQVDALLEDPGEGDPGGWRPRPSEEREAHSTR
jgi:DNA-binding FadR family transcriptional regulator